MRVVLAGASGLVGGMVLKNLAAGSDVSSITTFTRKPIGSEGSKHVPVVAPVSAWTEETVKASPNVGVCCLGTTIKAAGSRDAFAAIDLVAVQDFAQACRDGGARQFIMVTSVGADADARNFYLSTKGRAEAAVREIGFERLDIMRPGLLVGHREGPIRFGERIAIAISPLTDLLTPNVLSRYRSIPAQIVARAITACVGATGHGVFKHHNEEMRATRSDLD